MENFMIKKVYPAKCNNRNILPKVNPISESPEEWLSQDILDNYKINGFTFDFFINWRTINVSSEVWLKMLLPENTSYDFFKENLIKSLDDFWSKVYLYNMYSFTKLLNLKLYFIIFDDSQNWADDTSIIYKIEVKKKESFSLKIHKYNILAFKNNIRELSGGPVQIGKKGLIYGTSNLECFLSKTNALYPGDADLILTSEDNHPLCLIEFKKHNLKSKIEDENISNYYPNPDKRKYDRLYILQQYIIRQGFNIPLFILYFPTETIHSKWKLEKIEKINDELVAVNNELFDLPLKNDLATYNKVVTQILLKIEEWK
jgi:hypothetical protein